MLEPTIAPAKRWTIALCSLICVLAMTFTATADETGCPGKQCGSQSITAPAVVVDAKPVATGSKVEGWANVPGGTVWLRPGIDAYEHDTGLVRDTRTGQKSYPITPQSMAVHGPMVPRNPYPAPLPPLQPYAQPYALPAIAPPPVYPQPDFYRSGAYDFGPGNVYAGQPCNGCGAKLGAPGSINGRWHHVQ